MSDIARLQQALIAADAAGDVEAARLLAQAIRSQTSSPKEKAPDPSAGGGTLQFGPWDTGVKTPQWLDRTLSGAGKAFYDIGRGVGQMTGLADQQSIDEAKAQDAPLMATGAGKVGNIIGGAAIGAPAAFIPGANTAVGATLIGGGMGLLQPTATGESRGMNTAMGAAGGLAGYGLSKGIGALASRVKGSPSATSGGNASAQVGPSVAQGQTTVSGSVNANLKGGGYTYGSVGDDVSAGLNSAQKRALEAGKNLGLKVTPGQATGSRALQQMEAKLESQPMTSGPFNTIKADNAKNINRTFAKALGEKGDVVDEAVLGRFFNRVDKVYEDVADKATRQISPDDFLNRLSSIEMDKEGLLPVPLMDNPLVKRLTNFASRGEITGEQAQQLASKLGNAANKEMTTQAGDRELGDALFSVKDIVDDYLEQGLSGDRLKAFRDVRAQYRNFKLMAKGGALNPPTGNVSGAKFANTLAKADPRGYLAGGNQSDLYNAARFSQAFKPMVGDSGTATRMPLQGLTDLALRVPMNIATRMYTSSPAVNLAVGTQAAANAAGRAAGPALRPLLAPLAPIAPYALPGAGGLLGTYGAQ